MNANEKQTLTLPAGNVLTITAAAGVTGLVVRLPQSPGGGDAQSVTPIAGANLTFGAYAQPERFEISCTAGSLTYATAVPDPSLAQFDDEAAAALALKVDHALAKATSDFLVGNTGGGSWIKKTLAEVKTLLGIGADIPAATAENDFMVAGASPFAWARKALADVKTALGLGSAAYTESTAYDPAGTAAGIIASSISDSDTTHCPDGNSVFDALALKANLIAPAFVSVGLPEKTPVNATPTMLTLPVADLAILEAGDTVGFEGATFTKVSSGPGAGEFIDAAGLAALIDALDAWTGSSNEGAVSAVSVALGAAENGKVATITHLGATTSGGSEVDKATATIAAAEIARLAVGDQVTFDGSTFTKAAATSVPANEFANTSGLISCIDGMTAWTAAASGGDIKADAAENGEASNNKAINLLYYRASAGAVNGTVGIINEICADADYIYHAIAANTIADANWRKITLNAL